MLTAKTTRLLAVLFITVTAACVSLAWLRRSRAASGNARTSRAAYLARQMQLAKCARTRTSKLPLNRTLDAMLGKVEKARARFEAEDATELGVVLITALIGNMHTGGNLKKSLTEFDNNYNCKFKLPIWLLIDYLKFNKKDAEDKESTFTAGKQRVMDAIAHLPCSKDRVSLVRIDTYFARPENVDTRVMNGHIALIPMAEGYRNMCRFWAGMLYLLPELAKFDYYMRLDTDSTFATKLDRNIFEHMRERKITYAFRAMEGENSNCLAGLPEVFDDFFCGGDKRPHSLVDDQSIYYNNVEFGELAFFRSRQYQQLFQFADARAGFHHTRWGDAPFRTMAVDTMLPPGRVVQFVDFRYKHTADYHPNNAGRTGIVRHVCDLEVHRHNRTERVSPHTAHFFCNNCTRNDDGSVICARRRLDEWSNSYAWAQV